MSGHQVVLVRHGQTEWSLSGQHAGNTDIPLTEAGRRQALALGDRLSGWRFERVLSSPLARAMDTCRLAGMAERADLTDDLKEWDYGKYEGRRTFDIRKERPGWNLWLDGAPGGQTVDAVGRRADRVMEVIRAARDDVAVFAHGHILRVLAAGGSGCLRTTAGSSPCPRRPCRCSAGNGKRRSWSVGTIPPTNVEEFLRSPLFEGNHSELEDVSSQKFGLLKNLTRKTQPELELIS